MLRKELVQPEESSNCWYAHLRRSGRCSEHFDFADHVVLGVCQYFAIQVWIYLSACCQSAGWYAWTRESSSFRVVATFQRLVEMHASKFSTQVKARVVTPCQAFLFIRCLFASHLALISPKPPETKQKLKHSPPGRCSS